MLATVFGFVNILPLSCTIHPEKIDTIGKTLAFYAMAGERAASGHRLPATPPSLYRPKSSTSSRIT